jgi:hypothetical protein
MIKGVSIFCISVILLFSCQSPPKETEAQLDRESPNIAGPGDEINFVSYFPSDTALWFGIEDSTEFIRLISDREELEVAVIQVEGKPVLDENAETLIKNFGLQKEWVNGKTSKYSGKDFGLLADEGKTRSLAFEQLEEVSLNGRALQELTLEEFRQRYPKAYQVRNFGTKSDSKIMSSYPDSIPPSFDYSFLYLKDKAELRLFWIEGRLTEAYLIFGQQQRGDF